MVMKAIKKFVQQGMAANAGKGAEKSAYADAPDSSSADNATQAKAKAPKGKTAPNVNKEIAAVKKAGYTVYKGGEEL
jgi:hypothetical protein